MADPLWAPNQAGTTFDVADPGFLATNDTDQDTPLVFFDPVTNEPQVINFPEIDWGDVSAVDAWIDSLPPALQTQLAEDPSIKALMEAPPTTDTKAPPSDTASQSGQTALGGGTSGGNVSISAPPGGTQSSTPPPKLDGSDAPHGVLPGGPEAAGTSGSTDNLANPNPPSWWDSATSWMKETGGSLLDWAKDPKNAGLLAGAGAGALGLIEYLSNDPKNRTGTITTKDTGDETTTTGTSSATSQTGLGQQTSTGTSSSMGTNLSETLTKTSLPDWYKDMVQRQATALTSGDADYQTFLGQEGALLANTNLAPYMNQYRQAVWAPQEERMMSAAKQAQDELVAEQVLGGGNAWGTRGALLQAKQADDAARQLNEARNQFLMQGFDQAMGRAQYDQGTRFKDWQLLYEDPYKQLGALGNVRTETGQQTSALGSNINQSDTASASQNLNQTLGSQVGAGQTVVDRDLTKTQTTVEPKTSLLNTALGAAQVGLGVNSMFNQAQQ